MTKILPIVKPRFRSSCLIRKNIGFQVFNKKINTYFTKFKNLPDAFCKLLNYFLNRHYNLKLYPTDPRGRNWNEINLNTGNAAECQRLKQLTCNRLWRKKNKGDVYIWVINRQHCCDSVTHGWFLSALKTRGLH